MLVAKLNDKLKHIGHLEERGYKCPEQNVEISVLKDARKY